VLERAAKSACPLGSKKAPRTTLTVRLAQAPKLPYADDSGLGAGSSVRALRNGRLDHQAESWVGLVVRGVFLRPILLSPLVRCSCCRPALWPRIGEAILFWSRIDAAE